MSSSKKLGPILTRYLLLGGALSALVKNERPCQDLETSRIPIRQMMFALII